MSMLKGLATGLVLGSLYTWAYMDDGMSAVGALTFGIFAGLGLVFVLRSAAEYLDIVEFDRAERGSVQVDRDAEFIAHARSDIPKLLDEIERLKKQLDSVYEHGVYARPKVHPKLGTYTLNLSDRSEERNND